MARKSPHSRKISLLAMTLVGAAIIAPAPASASAARGHATKVVHHASTAAHKTASHKRTRRLRVSHHKTTLAPIIATASVQTPQAAASVYSSASTAPCADGGLIPTSANLVQVRAATLCLINQQRSAAGLAPLRENAALDAAAQAHSDDMVSGNYFDHDSPSGADPLSRVVAAGFATVARVLDLGENIAAGADSLATPDATIANWMASAPHRANILDPTFKQTGIGITAAVPSVLGLGGSGATYTQNFGTAD
jgi:uncharacterized protein YkwD